MKAMLVFIDGTICDTRGRHQLTGTPEFTLRERLLEDTAVAGSVECLNKLAERYEIVYMGARAEHTQAITAEWLEQQGYPPGNIHLAEAQEDRLALARELAGKHEFIAGIGDRWDDNALHAEIGCLSIILKEFDGEWGGVARRIDQHLRRQKINENRVHLHGKVEGLARVCPLLETRFGEGLWEAYFSAVMEMAERTRPARREEDLESFAYYNLDPNDLRDAAKWDEVLRQEDWEGNPAYGLQEFELVEATERRYVHKVTACHYAELWKAHGRADIGYQIHCHTDVAWWDKPAWNPEVRFEQPKTIMQGDEYCLFTQYIS
jgi:L-2-amino-thiazoline-4-carboxylic acid hydrolase